MDPAILFGSLVRRECGASRVRNTGKIEKYFTFFESVFFLEKYKISIFLI
jgi:hypothetical protein